MHSDVPWYLWVAAGLIVLFFLWMGVWGVVYIRAERACLGLGYRETRVTALLDRYCIVRIDQSDIVVPLSETTPRRGKGRNEDSLSK
jgi:hypothetical protein